MQFRKKGKKNQSLKNILATASSRLLPSLFHSDSHIFMSVQKDNSKRKRLHKILDN